MVVGPRPDPAVAGPATTGASPASRPPQDSDLSDDICLVEQEDEQPSARALKVDQTLVALMLEHATDGTVLVTRDGTILATTPAIERLIGLSPASLVGTNGIDLLHPDDVAPAIRRLDEIGRDIPEDYRTYRFRHRAGHWVTVELVANENPVPLADAPDGSFVLTVRDITEFHETRLALERSRMRREIIARLAAEFVDALDAELDTAVVHALEAIGHHTEADRASLFRVSPDSETASRTHAWCRPGHEWTADTDRVISVESFPAWRQRIENLEVIAVDDAGPVDGDWPVERAQLRHLGIGATLAVPLVRGGAAVGYLAIDVAGRPRTWGEEDIGLLQVTTDIIGSALARRDANLESRAAEARFRALVAQSTDAIIVLDRDARISHMPIGEQLFGYTPEGLFGMNALDLVHPDDLDFSMNEMVKAIADPQYHATNAIRIRHFDGHWVPIELVISSRFDEPGIDGLVMNVRDVTERDQAEYRLREANGRVAAMIDTLPGIVFRCSAQPPYADEYVSEMMAEVTGYSLDDIRRDVVVFDDLILAEHRHRTDRELEYAIAEHVPYVIEYPIRHRDGTTRWLSEHGRVIYSESGEAEFLEGFIFDITARVVAQDETRDTETRLTHLIANIPGAVFRCEPRAPYRDLFISDAIEDLTGYSPETFLRGEMDLYDRIIPEHRATVDHAIDDSTKRGLPYRVEFQFRHRDGSLRWVEERGQVILDDAGERAWIDGAMSDLTERKQLEERLAHDAGHDPLTGLPNRVLLMDHLHSTIARSRRSGTVVAALFLDLDRFKLVNDAMGHAAGDELLVHFSQRLRSVLRGSDLGARTGGDEFVVVCSELNSTGDAEAIARRIAEVLRDPFTIAGRTVFVSASIGIALADDRCDAGDLLRNADAAAYRAKERGRNRYEVFDDVLRTATAAALEIETDLHRAIERHQLFLRYQPVVELATGRLVGTEALVRWHHPVRGSLAPDEFLPAAEASGLIVPIGRQVLDLVIGALSDLPESLVPTIAMNVSPRELAQPDLVDAVRDHLTARGVAPERLCIEITESAVLDEVETAIATLQALRDLGLRLAIDDFGTGYSSLSYLRRLPVDVVKIDKSFTSEIGADGANVTIVAGIIGLAHGLGLEVIAEGIETHRQLKVLQDLGCTLGQGYLFSAPVAIDDLLAIDFERIHVGRVESAPR